MRIRFFVQVVLHFLLGSDFCWCYLIICTHFCFLAWSKKKQKFNFVSRSYVLVCREEESHLKKLAAQRKHLFWLMSVLFTDAFYGIIFFLYGCRIFLLLKAKRIFLDLYIYADILCSFLQTLWYPKIAVGYIHFYSIGV